MARALERVPQLPPRAGIGVGDDDLHGCLSDTPQFVPTPRGWDGCSVSRSPRSGRDGARGLDVAMHLLDEPLDRIEAPLAAQPGEEGDPQLAVVEVALEVEQEGLDEHAAAGDERRPHA